MIRRSWSTALTKQRFLSAPLEELASKSPTIAVFSILNYQTQQFSKAPPLEPLLKEIEDKILQLANIKSYTLVTSQFAYRVVEEVKAKPQVVARLQTGLSELADRVESNPRQG